jgi:hypothetical protein
LTFIYLAKTSLIQRSAIFFNTAAVSAVVSVVE